MRGTEASPGLISLAIQDIFQRISISKDKEYLLRVSYLEIYNEIITDLLNPMNRNLKIHEDLARNIFVGNLTENIVSSEADCKELLEKGESNRKIGQTNMNEYSSRSHTIFRIVVESSNIGDDSGSVKLSTIVSITYSRTLWI